MLRNSAVRVLTEERYGQIYFNGTVWTIVYDDTHTVEQIRFTLAHELGHMYLAHNHYKPKNGGIQPIFREYPAAEKQANMFAERLLCPSCVLAALEPQSPEEIARLCHVELDVAKRRFKRMTDLNKRDKYLTDPLEKELFESFLPYINEQNKARQESKDCDKRSVILP